MAAGTVIVTVFGPLVVLMSRPSPAPHGAVFPDAAGAVSVTGFRPVCGATWLVYAAMSSPCKGDQSP